MPLAGTFEVLDIGKVLDALARGSKSGRLQVRSGSVHATVLIKHGAAIGAEGSAAPAVGSRSWRARSRLAPHRREDSAKPTRGRVAPGSG